jgi:hypothetical protein
MLVSFGSPQYLASRQNRPSVNNTTARPPARLLPAKVAAAESGLPYTSLRDLAFRGEIPVVRFGSRWYFERTDLDALIAKHRELVGR